MKRKLHNKHCEGNFFWVKILSHFQKESKKLSHNVVSHSTDMAKHLSIVSSFDNIQQQRCQPLLTHTPHPPPFQGWTQKYQEHLHVSLSEHPQHIDYPKP